MVTKSNKEYDAPNDAPKPIKKFLKIWHSTGGKYCKFENIIVMDADFNHNPEYLKDIIQLQESNNFDMICFF